MTDDKKSTTVIAKPGASSSIVSIVNLILVVVVIWQSLSMSSLAHKVAEKEGAVQVIHQNYVAFFNWVRNEFQAVKGKSRAEGFFDKLFGREGREFPDLDQWEDPMKVPPFTPIEG